MILLLPMAFEVSVSAWARRAWFFLRQHAKSVASILTTLSAAIVIVAWCQNQGRVSISVRHYAPITISEGTIATVEQWVRENPGRAYEVVDVIWRNGRSVPEEHVSILTRIHDNGEILTCQLAVPTLRPQLTLRRNPNECEVILDRIAAGSTDSVRVRYRSPLISWIYLCELAGMRGDLCARPRPSGDSVFPILVSAEGSGPPIRVRKTEFILGVP